MTSATDELRRMLDEHDEYYKTSGNKTWWGRPIDRQTGKPINVFHYQAQPMGEDRLLIELQLATPAQAIAATLGNEGVGRSNDGVAELEAENARLRELVAGVSNLLFSLDVDYCATCPRDGINHQCPVYTIEGGECLYKTDLRDLGVEVDDG